MCVTHHTTKNKAHESKRCSTQAGVPHKFSEFPLFPFCTIGGLLPQKVAQSIQVNHMTDHGQMQRVSGAALDFLVVSSMVTINNPGISAPDTWRFVSYEFEVPRGYAAANFEPRLRGGRT